MSSDQDARSQGGMPAGQLAPPPPGSRYPLRRGRRRSWLIALLVVLVVVASVLTTLLVRANRHQTANQPAAPSGQPTSATAAPSSSGTTAAPSSSGTTAAPSGSPAPVVPPLLARGKEAPASAIPWSQVNAGWHLADWTSRSNLHLPLPEPLYTLYLVNPIGGRYRIATLPPHSIASLWSPDLRRTVVTSYTDPQVLREYDVSTGRQLASFVPGNNRNLLGYAGPGGHSLLLSVHATPTDLTSLELVSTAGVHQRYLPASTPQTGSFVLQRRPVLYFPDGSEFLIGGQHGFAVISNSGAVRRQLAFPAGETSCQLDRWWTAGTALVSCSNLFLVPLDGSPATTITYTPRPQYGFTNVWRFSGGIVAEEGTSCGPGGLDLIDSAGHLRPYYFQRPPGVSGRPEAVDVYADQVSLTTGVCGEPSGSLFNLDLRTGKTAALLGPGVNGGSVTNVVTLSGP